MLWGPTSSTAEWRCSVCERYCGSSHCDHIHHQSSTGQSWQLHRNSPVLPVEEFHMWYAAPNNQCSHWTPPHWTGMLVSQHCHVHEAFHTATLPTGTLPPQQQLYCEYGNLQVPSIHQLLWGEKQHYCIAGILVGENFGEFGELQSIRQSFLRQICLTLLFSMVECVLGAKIKFTNAQSSFGSFAKILTLQKLPAIRYITSLTEHPIITHTTLQ